MVVEPELGVAVIVAQIGERKEAGRVHESVMTHVNAQNNGVGNITPQTYLSISINAQGGFNKTTMSGKL